MSMHLDTITPLMHSVANKLHIILDADAYLAGGTALALHIGHRQSIDLDYFTPHDFDSATLIQQITTAFGQQSVQIISQEPDTLWCVIDGVKASVIKRIYPLLQPATKTDGMRLASLSDITVMKLSAICSREEYKDYFDLACLASHANEWIEWWKKIHPSTDILSWLVALSAVDTVKPIPLLVHKGFEQINPIDILTQVTHTITSRVHEIKS